jgi:hypothetical protein
MLPFAIKMRGSATIGPKSNAEGCHVIRPGYPREWLFSRQLWTQNVSRITLGRRSKCLTHPQLSDGDLECHMPRADYNLKPVRAFCRIPQNMIHFVISCASLGGRTEYCCQRRRLCALAGSTDKETYEIKRWASAAAIANL